MVGRQRGGQYLSIGNGCDVAQVVVHELVHAIGFYHSHMRSDRDKYLTLYWQNINPAARSQFQLLRPWENRIFESFDYESIMLYGARSFSNNGRSITMAPKQPGARLLDTQHKPGLSKNDASSINKLYRCNN